MFLLIILRLLFIIKWLFQFIGVLLSISLMGGVSSEKELTSIVILGFLILPEVVIGCVIWISKGASAISSRKLSNEFDIQSIPVFGKNLINVSCFSYMIVLMSVCVVIDSFFESSILPIEIAFLLCLFLSGKLKCFVEQYLEVKV